MDLCSPWSCGDGRRKRSRGGKREKTGNQLRSRRGRRSCAAAGDTGAVGKTGHPEMRKKGQADCGLKKEKPRVSGARNGYLQDRLVFVAEQLVRRQDGEAVGLEQIHGLVGLVETEDHDGTVSLTGDEGIHVFHIDAML